MSVVNLNGISHTLTKIQKADLTRRKQSHIRAAGPSLTHSIPRSQIEALEQKRSYFLGVRCLDCGTGARWAHNAYCMQCKPYEAQK